MRLIDADALLKHKSDHETISTHLIWNAPTVDAEPVRHGHWQITDAYPHNVHCSVCHKRFAQTHWGVWEDGSLPRNYCPNCGADMRGDNSEHE